MSHDEVNLLRAAKADDNVGASQGLTRDETSDSLVARVKRNKEGDRLEANDDAE